MTVLARHLARVKPNHLTAPACRNASPVAWMAFLPARLRIRVGQTVAFKVDSSHEPHIFTFGPQAHTGAIGRTLLEQQPRAEPTDRTDHQPTRSRSSDPFGSPLIHAGANHGNGFVNSGVLDTNPHTPNPSEVAERITFTKLGTYYFECVTYPNIDNTITVTR